MTAHSRIAAVATAYLLACGAQNPPAQDLAGSDMAAPLDLTAADLGPVPCAGWACETDANCPPTLCAAATGFGVCQSGFCRWR